MGGIHEYFAINLETKVVFMKCEKKKLKPLGHPAGPSGLRSGPRAQPDAQVVSTYFIFALHETTLVSRFIAKIFVKPPKKIKKTNEPGHKKKGGLLLIPRISSCFVIFRQSSTVPLKSES